MYDSPSVETENTPLFRKLLSTLINVSSSGADERRCHSGIRVIDRVVVQVIE